MAQHKHQNNHTTVAERQANMLEQDKQAKKKVAEIRVMILDDVVLMREGIRQLLLQAEHIQVVGEMDSSLAVLRHVRLLKPDIILLGLNASLLDVHYFIQQIMRHSAQTPIILLTHQEEQEQVIQALKGGVRGYLLKKASSQDLLQAIQTVYEGDVYIEPGLTGVLVDELQRLTEALPESQDENILTEKEIEIIRAISRGLTNKEIADELGYSEKTVKNYLSIIFQKLQLRDRTQVAIYALRHGLVSQFEETNPQ